MDSWYATKEMMLAIDELHKIYYCPLKDNRQVDDSGGTSPYQRVDSLEWTQAEKQSDVLCPLRGTASQSTHTPLGHVTLCLPRPGSGCL
jgi:hypothetical protein